MSLNLINKLNALEDVPKPSDNWVALDKEHRIEKVKLFLKNISDYNEIKVINANENGHVIIEIGFNIDASKRGLFLLDMEQKMKKEIDKSITVWLNPIGDKSKLRALRGITIKDI